MRDILFRGKATNREDYRVYRTTYKNGDWVYGLLTDKENYLGFAEMTNEAGVQCIEVDKDTVEQYTGLIDKNGKKIFEGDICDFSILGRDHTLVEISIQHGCAGFEPLDYDSVHPDDQEWKSFWDNEEHYMWNTNYFTVIGNIHDNPELLNN